MKREEKIELLSLSIHLVVLWLISTGITFVYVTILKMDFGIPALHDPVVCCEVGFLLASLSLFRRWEKDQKARVDVVN